MQEGLSAPTLPPFGGKLIQEYEERGRAIAEEPLLGPPTDRGQGILDASLDAHVGSTESKIQKAARLIDTLEGCVLLLEQEVKAKKAGVVWLQEDVVHEEAAAKARAAGLDVIQDRCIYKEWLRLMNG